jgi:hypothetical protein
LAVVTAVVTLGLIAVGSVASGDPITTTAPPGTTGTPTRDPGPGGSGPAPAAPGASGPGAGVGFDEAVRIAEDRVGGGRVTDVEWDHEHGRAVWEIEIMDGRMEHDLRLDAGSGTVLRHERDYDDDHYYDD